VSTGVHLWLGRAGCSEVLSLGVRSSATLLVIGRPLHDFKLEVQLLAAKDVAQIELPELAREANSSYSTFIFTPFFVHRH
jgi:hypothetical protein